MGSSIKRNFLAGLLVLLPFALTIFVLFKLSRWMIDAISAAPAKLLIPLQLQDLPSYVFELTTFAIGLLGTLLIVLIIGTIARNFIGKRLVSFIEGIMLKIPLARTIYTATKQIIETLFSADDKKGFKKVAIMEYPRKGVYSIGFITDTMNVGEKHNKSEEKLLSIFVPTTPNPTSGFYIMLPEGDVTELDISVEDAFTLIVSAGLATDKVEYKK